MGFYTGGKNESAPFFFSQLKTKKTEMGYTFLTAVDTLVEGSFFFNHETLMIFLPSASWYENGRFFKLDSGFFSAVLPRSEQTQSPLPFENCENWKTLKKIDKIQEAKHFGNSYDKSYVNSEDDEL